MVESGQGDLQESTLRLAIVRALVVDREERRQAALAGGDEGQVVVRSDLVQAVGIDGFDLEAAAALEESTEAVIGT
ncbi:Uncharacterised protein [Mycobacteroides abscessus subsp. abscessus]|nr:Uncharacterised protein [Mycobacteroides abscessus subsp. abscessus]